MPTVTAQPFTFAPTSTKFDRKYRLVNPPSIAPKGRQRQIVLHILTESQKPMSPKEVAELAGPMGLYAVGGILPSCQYHLHQMALMGIVEVVN